MSVGPLLTLAALIVSSQSPPRVGDFDAEIAPILARHCLDCHNGPDPKGKLNLSTRAGAAVGGESGPAIVPHSLEESVLWERLEAGDMPPDKPIPVEERDRLRDWIESGAAWGSDPIDIFRFTTERRAGREWWSLQPIRTTVPQFVRSDWSTNPVDAFILNRLESAGLSPAPLADRTTLIRRLTFDLTGLPPKPSEIEAFLVNDHPAAYERVVDRLLASPHYGVRWARRWLDLARYGESNGFEFDEFRPDAWRYRDWVVHALNADLPYDRFARLQIAGDVLRPADADAVDATGFLVAGAYDTVGQTQQSEAMKAVVRADETEDYVGTLSQTFLGLTVHCARCHDHKFDPIAQTDYYRIASALAGVRPGTRDLTALDPNLPTLRAAIADINRQIDAIEQEAIAELREPKGDPLPPRPVAAWDFTTGLDDQIGRLDATLQGHAERTPDGLRLDGQDGYAEAPLPPRSLRAKTFEAWVTLGDRAQGGGAVLGASAGDGLRFDALVYAERQPGRWMAGSENFTRTRDRLDSPLEAEAFDRPIHVVATYAEDGTIALYRDGQPYGEPYRVESPATFEPGQGRILFGMRHGPPGGNRMLAGVIHRARLYDQALTPGQIAASAAAPDRLVTRAALEAALAPEARAARNSLLEERGRLDREVHAADRKSYAVDPRTPGVTRVSIRGNPAQPGAVVAPGGIAGVSTPTANFGLAPDSPDGDRRVALAKWMTAADNPLFARVIVNRLWQAHFGEGLVAAPSDFGFNGGQPSHPELLDFLASELIRRDWSLKAIQRRIVTSAAYRQSSRPDADALAVDASDRLLWRHAPRRLEAEMIRDAMLSVSGSLDPRLGGPGFFDHTPTKATGTAAILYVPVDPTATAGLDRRTLYRAWPRGGRSTLLDGLDCPDPSTTAPRRAVTITPLQALSLWNGALSLHLADRFADRLIREAGDDPTRQVERAFQLAYGRPPTPDERARSAELVARFGAAALARVLFNSSEFLFLP